MNKYPNDRDLNRLLATVDQYPDEAHIRIKASELRTLLAELVAIRTVARLAAEPHEEVLT